MGKLRLFGINFNNDRQVFYPGEQLSGYVIIELNEPMETRGVRIEFEGKGYCHWTEQHGSGDNRRTVRYTGREQLFHFVSPLFGSLPNSNGSKVMLTQGQSTFPFVFTIPPNLPSSFEGRSGHIRFELKAEIDKPWKFNHKVKRPVILNALIDPNNPQYLYAPGGSDHKDVGCMCCAAGPLDITANVDRACFCPGENILITSKVENKTSRDMQAMKGKLVRVVAYHATTKTRHHEDVVARIDGPAIPKGEFANWEHQPLPIPAVNPSILQSRVITVSYYVKVEVDVPWGLDPAVKIPVIIGTVPFRYGQPPVMQNVQQQPNPNNASAPPPPPGYPDMAPPSYASAVGEQPINIAGDDDKYTQGNLTYIPIYAFAQPQQGVSGQAYPPTQPLPPGPPTDFQPYPPPTQGYPSAGAPPSGQPYPPPVGQPYPPPAGQPYPPPVDQPYPPPGQIITQQPGPYPPSQFPASAPPPPSSMQEKPPQ